jgi:hypothetical protein
VTHPKPSRWLQVTTQVSLSADADQQRIERTQTSFSLDASYRRPMMEEESATTSSFYSFVFLLILRIQESMRRNSILAFEYDIVVLQPRPACCDTTIYASAAS